MSRSRLPLLAAALVALAAPAGAQQGAAADAPRPAAPAIVAAPVTTPAAARSMVEAPAPVAATREGSVSTEARAAEVLRAERAREAGVAVAQAGSQRDGKVYMIVGGAAFLAGAIIGDDAGTIIMVGGAAVGLYGLYLYLQ